MVTKKSEQVIILYFVCWNICSIRAVVTKNIKKYILLDSVAAVAACNHVAHKREGYFRVASTEGHWTRWCMLC